MQEDEKFITKYVDDLKRKALFLEQKGFSIVGVSEYIIEYLRKDCCLIGIYYGRYSDEADVYIRFETPPPEVYSLSWFRTLKKFEAGEDVFQRGETEDKLTILLNLLAYLEDYYYEITDIEYCRKVRKKIHENFENGVWDIPQFNP